MSVRLYLAQRISALVMAPLVLGHLAMMIYAVRNGVDAAEILARTRGSVAWATFYGLFVIAVAVHAAIGLRTVACEWLKLRGSALEIFALSVCMSLLVLGGRAVYAVVS